MFEIRPTPQEVVQFKKDAESLVLDYNEMIESVQFKIEHTTDPELLKELHEDLVSWQASRTLYRNHMFAKVNLSETKLE